MSEKYFCPSCGEEVETVVVAYDRRKEKCCIFCGFPLETMHALQFSSQKSVFIVDDSKLLVEMIRDYFNTNHLAKTIYCAYDGGSFLTNFIQRLRFGEEVGLIILDIVLPVISGINAAIAMRAIEKGYGAERIPILFFSAKRADEGLVNAMKYCAPAHYICKGIANDPKDLCERIYKVANNLLKVSQKTTESAKSE